MAGGVSLARVAVLMDDVRARKIIALALRAGQVQLANSVSVAECMESLQHLCDALGLEGAQVIVELNTITISHLAADLSSGGSMTRAVEIGRPQVHRLVAVQDLIERVGRREVGLDEAWEELGAIESAPDPHRASYRLVAELVSVAAWAVFAGGDGVSVIAAVLAAVGVHVAFSVITGSRIPDVFATVAAAWIVVMVPYGIAGAGIDFRVSPAVVGGLYPLLPGAALVASVTDGLSGAPMSSLARGLQAVLTAVAVALGVLAGLNLAGALGIELPDVPAGPWAPVVTAMAAGAAVALHAVANQVPARLVAPIAPLGAAVWIVAWLGGDRGLDADVAVACAALLLGMAGGLLARAQNSWSSIYTSSAIFVLVPGTTLYLAMLAFATGGVDAGFTLTTDALVTSLAIAVGVTLGVAVGGALPAPPSAVRLLPGHRPGRGRGDGG